MSWKCPSCNSVNGDPVTQCSCGKAWRCPSCGKLATTPIKECSCGYVKQDVPDGELREVYRQKAFRSGRVLRPLGLILAGLAALMTLLISVVDEKTLGSLPYLLAFAPFLIVIGGAVVFFYMNYSWFSNTAKGEGRSGFGWGIIGSLSFIVPARLFQEFVFPLFIKERVTIETVGYYTFVSWFLGIIIAVLCTLLVHRIFFSSSAVSSRRRE